MVSKKKDQSVEISNHNIDFINPLYASGEVYHSFVTVAA